MDMFNIIPAWQPVFDQLWNGFMIILMTVFLAKLVISTIIFMIADIRSDWNRYMKRRDEAKPLPNPDTAVS